MGFPRQEYWGGLPGPFPGDLPDPGIEPESPTYPTLAVGFFTTEPPGMTFHTQAKEPQWTAKNFKIILPLL